MENQTREEGGCGNGGVVGTAELGVGQEGVE